MGNVPSGNDDATTTGSSNGNHNHNGNHNDDGNHHESNSGGNKHRRNSKSTGNRSSKDRDSKNSSSNNISSRVGEFSAQLLAQDHPAVALLDSMCGPLLNGVGMGDPSSSSSNKNNNNKNPKNNNSKDVRSLYSEDASEDDYSRTLSEEETTVATDYHNTNKGKSSSNNNKNNKIYNNSGKNSSKKDAATVDSRSMASEYDAASGTQPSVRRRRRRRRNDEEEDYDDDEEEYDDDEDYEDDEETEDDDTYTASRVTTATSAEETTTVATSVAPPSSSNHRHNHNNHQSMKGLLSKQPLASSFAKRCYFTKAGIGGHTQHYEGLTLTGGNILLMLASAMKLKGCPTICDEDLRRVEQTYPNQFSRLPDELLLSSGWRRISKYCHFSNKPIPDGIPFFHSKQRLHPSGGYYFLLAAAVGMVRPIDVEPLNRDTLVLLETDFPSQCDAAPAVLIQDPAEWTLVDKFCFFSGGPINTDEDVYYMADFDGNPIYMLAFLSPSLTPSELYKLDNEEPLASTAAVEEVESVYDLTERDFDDLKLYHLGPCRALPQYILQPMSWTKVLPPHFLAARETALMRAQDYEEEHGLVPSRHTNPDYQTSHLEDGRFYPEDQAYQQYDQQTPTSHYDQQTHPNQHLRMQHQPIYSQSQQQQPLYSYGVRPPFETSPIQHPMQGSVASTAASPYVGHERYESLFHHQQNATSRTPSSYLRHIQGDRDAMAAMDDTSLPIDEAIASHAARAGPPVPLASSMGGGGIDPPEDEPPSLRKRGGVAYRSNSITSADPSHRSAHNMEASAFQGSAYHEGSAYNEGSAYQGSTYQEGSAYDESIEHHTSYYQEENDTYNDFHQRKIQYHPNDEYQHDEGYDQQQPTQSEDEYDGQGEFTDFERTEHYQQGDEFHQRADFLHHSDKHDNELRHESYDESSPKASESHFSAPYSPDDEIAENSPFNMKYNLSPTSETEVTEFTVPTVTEGPYGAESPNSSADYSNHVHENSRQHGNSPLPPMSPRSANGTEYSQSSAMRGAQELLRRNRQKRLELAQRMKSPDEKASCEGEAATPDDEGINPDVISPQSQDSNSTWQTGASEHTSSEVTGGSSMWDGDSHPDRSSRRALILQMARARMKSHGIKGVDAGGLEDEKKLDPARDSTNDIDITADLD